MTKAKYIILRHITRKVVWISRFINKINLDIVENIMLYEDNKMSIHLTKNAKSQHRTKHINI